MQILDHEQFEGAKELAEIGTKIAEGRALISTLEASKEDFLNGREHEAIERIQAVLASSQDLIAEIGKNHDSLVGYRREVTEYVTDLRYFIEAVTAWKEAIEGGITAQSAELEAKRAKVEELIISEKKESTRLESERNLINRERQDLANETRKMQSERGTLERAWKELEAKKKK